MTAGEGSEAVAARFLEQTLLWNFVIHGVAMLTMALILLPTLPGGPVHDDAQRIASIAERPWLWRLGWLPWHLCAAIDLVMGAALVWTRWVPKVPAVLTLLVTICAVCFEQTGEIGWTSQGVELAIEAHRAGDPSGYLAYERWAYQLTVVVGASLYLVMALGWTWCFVAAGTWSRALTILSPFTWGSLAIGSAGLLLPEPVRPGDTLVGVSNGLGFLLMQVWLMLVAEQVLRRSRPDEAHGRLAVWRHPWSGIVGRCLDGIANSRFCRALGEWLPVPGFRSDIATVLYVNYLVEAERLEQFVPRGLKLQRIGPNGKWALFSSLTYRHGGFGPALLGPLRKLMPSPVQSNWRTYIFDPCSGRRGIYFVTNAIDSTIHALGARLLSEGMPMHKIHRGEVSPTRVKLEPGDGSAPDLEANVRIGSPTLPEPFSEVWGSYLEFLKYAVTQDRAFSAQPWYSRITRQEIELGGVVLDEVEPLDGEARSEAVKAYVGDAIAVCFRVRGVAFRLVGERHEDCPVE